jgi:hypothetical protein
MKKYFTILFALVLFGIPVYLNVTHSGDSDFIMQIVIYILLPFFVFNMIARKSLLFKPYFTSKYNFMLECQKENFRYDLSKDLMFAKLIELVNDSSLKLAQHNEENGQILATTSLSFKSWGENIYFTLVQKDTYTEVTIEMTTISQVSSWGKNRANYKTILNQFEESLTI